MEDVYFKRKINEGSVKSTHVCSFDNSIILTKLVQKGTKVVDNVIASAASKNDKAENELSIKKDLISRISALRINGKQIVFEDLGECFDETEIVEVISFINDADMSRFGGKKQTEAEKSESEIKNA